MEITKVNLKDCDQVVYETYMKDEPDAEPVHMTYNIEEIAPGETLNFSNANEASYHVLIEGEVSCRMNGESESAVAVGEEFYCEQDDSMEITGKGRIFSMIMKKGIRGVVRMIRLQGEKGMKIGEAIGECCMAFVGLNGGFALETEKERYVCAQGEAIFIRMNKNEYVKVRLIAEEKVQIGAFQSVKMYDSDFSQHIGVRTIEQGYGHCKVRLDITKDHMNPIGSVHGGAIFTMADEACGISAATTGGICTTVDSHIEYLNPAIGVKYLIAEAKAKKIGKKIRTFTVDIRSESDVLVASADFIFYCLQN